MMYLVRFVDPNPQVKGGTKQLRFANDHSSVYRHYTDRAISCHTLCK